MTAVESRMVKAGSHKYYVFFVVLSLVLYIFGHSTEYGTLPFPDKLFYVPCSLSLVLAALNKDYWTFMRADRYFIVFYLLSFFYSAIFIRLDPEDMIACAIGFLAFRYLSRTQLRDVLGLLAVFAPVIIAIHYISSNPLSLSVGYRYSGYQGDPNCFSYAMNILLYACGFTIIYGKNKVLKVLSFFSVIGIVPLIMAAASRTGIAIMAVVLIYILFAVYRKKKFLSFLIVVLLVVYGELLMPRLDSQIQTISNRYEVIFENGSDYRMEEFKIVPSLLLAHPEYMLFGIGYSQSINAHQKFDEYYHEGRAHNTYMSVLLEQGVVGFVLFLLFLFNIGKIVFKNRCFVDGNYRMILYLIVLFFIFSIYSLSFLPFWFSVYVASNQYDIAS